jgi:hypothetical protein
MEPTYENIQSLLVEETWTGNQVNLKFKAKNQEQAIETMGIAIPNQEEMMKKIAIEMAKVTASNAAINTAGNTLGNLAGISGAGGVISGLANQANLGYQMDPNSLMSGDVSDDAKKETIVNAFKGVMSFYEFSNGEWIAK